MRGVPTSPKIVFYIRICTITCIIVNSLILDLHRYVCI